MRHSTKMTKINLLAPRVPPPGAKRIPLTQGQATFVSEEDFERISQHKWHATWEPNTKSYYAQREIRLPNGTRTTQGMHREILGLEPGDPRQGHHENHDTLDNRRENLEIVTLSEHRHEHRDDPRKNQSEYGPGVQKSKSGRFRAQVWIRGRRYHVGMFDTPEQAQRARRLYIGNTLALFDLREKSA